MGTSAEGLPVIKQDLMWGRFVTERYSALDCIRAYLLFLEENVIMAPTFLERQIVVVSYGGFCPVDWGKALVAILQDNYPERLVRAVIWPVPGFLAKTVRAFVHLLAAKETSAKISIETDESRMLLHTKMEASQLPDYMEGGIGAIVERDRPDPKLIKKLVLDGFMGRGRNTELEGWPPPDACPATPASKAASPSASCDADLASFGGCLGGLAASLCGCWTRREGSCCPPPQAPLKAAAVRGEEPPTAGWQPPQTHCPAPQACGAQAFRSPLAFLPRSVVLALVLVPVLVSSLAPALRALSADEPS